MLIIALLKCVYISKEQFEMEMEWYDYLEKVSDTIIFTVASFRV